MNYMELTYSPLIWILISFIGGMLGILFALILTKNILNSKEGSEGMKKISDAIKKGASTYLYRQYKTVAVITVLLTIPIAVFLNVATAITFVLGAVLSALAGYIGMMVSVRANVRTAEAAKKGLGRAFQLAFQGGAVTGFAVAGLGLVGVVVLFVIFKNPEIPHRFWIRS